LTCPQTIDNKSTIINYISRKIEKKFKSYFFLKKIQKENYILQFDHISITIKKKN